MSSPIKRLVWFAAVLLAGFWILALLAFRTRVRTGGADLAMEFLAQSSLGPLPAGATNVLFHSWSGPITGEIWLRFELPPGDLAKFIADSPALSGIEPKETYDREHPLLPFPVEIYTNASVDFRGLEIYPGARFHIRNQSDPDWYVTTIVGQGRMYFLWPNAWLHLDEERGIVWLKVVKG